MKEEPPKPRAPESASPPTAEAVVPLGVAGETQASLPDPRDILAHADLEGAVGSASLDAFREAIAGEDSQAARVPGPPAFRAGDVVGRFALLRTIGEGGFGMVFEAEDTDLGRRVALKVMRARPEMTERLASKFAALFRREAQTAARLNHPNIMTLYDVGTAFGLPYLVLELLHGEPLSERLKRGRLGVVEALDVMLGVARGLAHAHRSGVIHRDLKPSNVYLCADGTSKILDLGLARVSGVFEGAGAEERAAVEPSRGLTLMSGAGTPAYMAPEQWLRQRQDARTDVFAFGVLLYELLVGERPWIAVLREDRPSDEALRHKLAPISQPLADLVVRMVAEGPDARPASMDEVVCELSRVRELLAPNPARRARRRWLIALFASIVAAGVAAAVVLPWTSSDTPAPAPPRPPPTHRQLTFLGDVGLPELSPDGRVLAYVHDKKLWVRDLEGGAGEVVHGGARYTGLRWAPDGSELRFAAVEANGGRPFALQWPERKLRPIAVGGRVQAFAPDGKLVAVGSGAGHLGLYDREGREVRAVERPAGTRFVMGLDWGAKGGLVALTMQAERLSLHHLDPRTGAAKSLIASATGLTSPRFAPAGDAVYYLSATRGTRDLWRLALGADGSPAGAPTNALSGLPLGEHFSASRDGRRIACTRVERFSHLATSALGDARADDGTLESRALTKGTLRVRLGRFSPDGRSLAYAAGERPTSDLFVMPSGGGPARRVATGLGWLESLAWSPDGRSLAVVAQRDAARLIHIVDASSGAARALSVAVPPNEGPSGIDWSRRGLAYAVMGLGPPRLVDPATGQDLAGIDPTAPKAHHFSPRFSKDGSALAAYVNAPAGSIGLRIFDLERRSSRLIPLRSVAFPVAFDDDGQSLFVAPQGPSAVETIARLEQRALADGRLERTFRFPEGRRAIDLDVAPAGDHVVVTLEDRRSDAWLIEGLDL